MADPTFEIDPSFPLASDFELEFSPDDSADVPEPRSTLILVLALVLLACLRRRRLVAASHMAS